MAVVEISLRVKTELREEWAAALQVVVGLRRRTQRVVPGATVVLPQEAGLIRVAEAEVLVTGMAAEAVGEVHRLSL
jgi:hypothetical protein